ncbi:SBBP repeat-containing protein [Hydrocoleum sp. CS-953]|uniref:SBBP repeat-containing protein n=1 Tax=Hydrocoleum sp. CS-953 TaxID=1671698 RepID=UPI000B9B7AAD|nr:SBBP repeat-containing protein [Hydrocoleum sp. CS-953]
MSEESLFVNSESTLIPDFLQVPGEIPLEIISVVENLPEISENITETNNPNNDNDEILINAHRFIQASQLPTTNDPSLEFSDLIGGSNLEEGTGITIDNQGNTYITGSTNSIDFPITPNAVQNSFGGGDEFGNGDAFVAKYSPDGTLIYATYIGGSGGDFGTDIAVDITGDIYVTGNTNSIDFPTVNAWQNTYGGGEFSGDAFVVKLSNDGSNILYSTYLGGQDNDFSSAISVDNNGNAYITGDTGAVLRFPIQPIPGIGNFPTTENALQNTLISEFNRDAFVSKISTNGNQLIYSTLLGGNDTEISQDITVDNNGNAYITGETRSFDFPTINAVQNIIGGDADIFITQLNSDGSDLIFSTYYGGVDGDIGNGIAIDDFGNIYVAGNSGSQIIGGDTVVPPVGQFPTVNALQNTFGGGESDGILIKINSDRFVEYATYLGTADFESIESIDIDAGGNSHIISNNDFANTVVSKISNDGQVIEYSIPFRINDNLGLFGNDIAVDEIGNAYFVGFTIPTFPLEPFLEVSQVGNVDIIDDAFVAKLAANNSSPGIPSFVPPPNIPESFNENFYLIENPGVANALANGLFISGFEHWLEFGFSEGRSPQFAFEEEFYLANNPVVAQAVVNGIFVNGLEHYVRFGQAEGRLAIG